MDIEIKKFNKISLKLRLKVLQIIFDTKLLI